MQYLKWLEDYGVAQEIHHFVGLARGLGVAAAICLAFGLGLYWFVRRRRRAAQLKIAPTPSQGGESQNGQIGPGSRLGDYRVLRSLARGSGAEVFLGEGNDGVAVAIKVLFRDVGHDSEFRIRFEREAQVCASLDHPRLVKTYAWSVRDNRFWMAQTYLPGGSLQAWVKPSGMQPGEVKKVMLQIAEGLLHAHDKGIFHRDIKPENILLNAKGEPVIADFGLARRPTMQTISQKNDIVGSPAFISPEQIDGGAIDGRADLYSLGVIGYELLTGVLPFRGKTMDVLISHLRQAPPPLREINPQISPEFEAVILKLLSKKAEDRYASARDLIAALNAL